jgi:NAD(P)-dependent dehydrogenase (short-subunit alcohol dehydrogenase family)
MSQVERLFGLRDKVALVTGGATGIGRMAATALVGAGARVMIASRKADACAAAAEELNALGGPGSAEGFAGDVGSEEAVRTLAAEVGRRTDRLHILLNNAGITWGEPLASFPHAQWARVMGVNVAGLFTLTRDLLALLEAAARPSDPARIINLGSVMGTVPLAEGAYSYAASKAAVHHLTRILARELAPRHITVNAFAPGPFPSRMTRFAIGSAEQQARVGANVPLGRVGEPEDIAGATLFLCGRAGAYVTGAILPLDGGMSAAGPANLFAEAGA